MSYVFIKRVTFEDWISKKTDYNAIKTCSNVVMSIKINIY